MQHMNGNTAVTTTDYKTLARQTELHTAITIRWHD